MARKRRGDADGPVVVRFSDQEMQYKPEEFLCPGQDDHGNSVRLTFRCPPIMERDLEIIRDNRHLPYKTISDIVRHAVYRHLHWLHEMEDMPQHILTGLDMVMEVCRDAEMRSKVEETFVAMDRIIDQRLQDGEKDEAMRLMTETKQKILKMPNSRWRQNWLDRFTRKYAVYLMAPAEVQATGTADNVIHFPVENTDDSQD